MVTASLLALRAARVQVGATDGLAISVAGTSCGYVAAASSSGRRRLRAATSQLDQIVSGTLTTGDPLISNRTAQLLAGDVSGAVGTQAAKAALLGAAVTTPGYDAAAGAAKMTVQTMEAHAVDTLPLLPPSAPAPRWAASSAAAALSTGVQCTPSRPGRALGPLEPMLEWWNPACLD